MKKVIRIPIFLFPWEIDSFQNLADRLKLCANFIKDDPDYNIIVDVTLNISDKATNWDNSSLKPEFFTSSFKSICSKLNHFLPTEYTIEESNQVFGCVVDVHLAHCTLTAATRNNFSRKKKHRIQMCNLFG